MIFKIPEIGSKKTVVKFCIFPIFFENKIYWLEKTVILYARIQIPKKYSYGYTRKWVIERMESIKGEIYE